MIRLTDGKKTILIEMRVWKDGNYSPDWSHDFFEVGLLPYNEEQESYIVEDIEYCIEQALDWKREKRTREVWVYE